MTRLFLGAAWGGILLSLLGALATAKVGTSWIPFVAVAALSAAYLLKHYVHDREVNRALPRSLDRLAYRPDASSVAFAWKCHGRRMRRVRILRSLGRGARSPDEGPTSGQTLVWDGSWNTAVDQYVEPGMEYHYSVFVEERRGRWSEPVHLIVLTLSLDDRRAVEQSSDAPTWSEDVPALSERRDALGTTIIADPASDPHGVDVDRSLALGTTGGAYILGTAISGLVTDLVFTAAEVFAAREPADGWEEVT